MAGKKQIYILTAIIVLIISAFVVIKIWPKQGFSDNPKDWIETKGSVSEINVEKATEGAGHLDYIGQQYRVGEVITAFGYDGIYKGELFKKEYADENGDTMIRITSDLNPNNGVIEGFILEKVIDNKPVAFIFVDEDWKQQMRQTNIFWGSDYEHYKEFTYQEISNGIYVTQINDDKSRFDNNYLESKGGIIVGDISVDNIENNDLNDVIVIRMY